MLNISKYFELDELDEDDAIFYFLTEFTNINIVDLCDAQRHLMYFHFLLTYLLESIKNFCFFGCSEFIFLFWNSYILKGENS